MWRSYHLQVYLLLRGLCLSAVSDRYCTGNYIGVTEQRIACRPYTSNLPSACAVHTLAALGTCPGLGCMTLGTQMLFSLQSIPNLAAVATGPLPSSTSFGSGSKCQKTFIRKFWRWGGGKGARSRPAALWLWSLHALVLHIRQEAIAYFLAGFVF